MICFENLVTILAELNDTLEKVDEAPEWNIMFEYRTFNPKKRDWNDSVKQSLTQYCELAKTFKLESDDFVEIFDYIMKPIEYIFIKKESVVVDSLGKKFEHDNSTIVAFKAPAMATPYSSIIGPSFMGKTQLSFILARKTPVFYFNFCEMSHSIQDIYKHFNEYKSELLKILQIDLILVNNLEKKSESGSEHLISNLDVKLLTVGFIWHLIQHSLKFDFNSSEEHWYYFYLKIGPFSYPPMSLNEFHANMSK